MSKKILKRSLALGVLMAFVISGGAWAERATLGNGDFVVDSNNVYEAKYGIYDHTDNSGATGTFVHAKEWELGTYTLKVTGTVEGLTEKNAVYANYYHFNGGEGSTLQISNSDGTGLDGNGLRTHGKINVDNLIIRTSGIAIASYGYESEINANNIEIVTTKGDGIVATESGDIMIDTNGGKLSIDAFDDALKTGKGDELSINTGELEIKSNAGDAINAKYENSNISVTATGKATVSGDILASTATDSVSFNMTTDDSVFTGAVTGNGTKNIGLGFGTWKVTGESTVTELSGTDAKIEVTEVKEGLVKVDTVEDNSKFTVAASADAEGLNNDAEADLLAVSKTVVTGNDENQKAVADTVKITGGSVYDEVSAEIKEDGTLGNVNKQVASANVSVNDMVAIGLMSWRAEMNDMNKRMGELRNANGEHGVWVRMVRGESEYNSVKNQYNQYQLGYDEKLSVDKRWTVGVALSYTDAENNFAQGTGESTNKALSVYGSKLNDDGTFIDLIAKYARLENDFTVQGGQGDADYDTNAYSFSAEVGKRIQQGKGLWIEPQVELTYGKVSAVDYVTKNDVKVAQDGMESLVGRIGFSLGKDIEKGNVYARASYLYDFDGETKATLNNDAVLENDLGGGWWEVGVGANINLSKATYIYADIEKTFGGEVDTNWQWNLGVRYSF